MIKKHSLDCFKEFYKGEKNKGKIKFGKPPEGYEADERKFLRWTKGKDLVLPEDNVYYQGEVDEIIGAKDGRGITI